MSDARTMNSFESGSEDMNLKFFTQTFSLSCNILSRPDLSCVLCSNPKLSPGMDKAHVSLLSAVFHKKDLDGRQSRLQREERSFGDFP